MNIKFYLKPIKRLGMDQWLAFAVDPRGSVVWQATRWSERQVRTEALRQQAKGQPRYPIHRALNRIG